MSYKTNLLEETLQELKQFGKTPEDVKWVGTSDSITGWEIFANLAKDVIYDSGYGGNEIRASLKIVGKDWWLERGEYDGSEWWEFKTLPTRPLNEIFTTKEILEARWYSE